MSMLFGNMEITCPGCGAMDADRVHRTVFEKIVTQHKRRKYCCRKCRRKFFGKPMTPRRG